MKKMLFLLALAAGPAAVYGQADFQFFRPDVQYLYAYPEASYLESGIIGMKLTDAPCQPTYPAIKYLGEFECNRASSAFAGARVCQNDTETLLQIDTAITLTIRHQAPIGVTWQVGQVGDTLIFGEVTAIGPGEFLGLEDSVKTIRFSTEDLAGNPVVTAVDGKSIAISQHYGLISALWFRDFPSVGYVLPIAGISEPDAGIHNPGTQEIFDLHPGDELHIYSRIDGFMGNSVRRDKYKITGRQFDQEHNMLRFDFQDQSLYIETYPEQDTVIADTAGYWDFYLDQFAFLDRQPGELFIDTFLQTPPQTIALQLNQTCDLPGKHLAYPLFEQNEGCLRVPLDVNDSPLYLSGAAGGYYSFSSLGGFSSRVLVYLKNGDGECGTPFDFDSILNSVRERPEPFAFNAWPNPVLSDELNLAMTAVNLPAELKLYDLTGHVVYRKTLETETTRMSISGITAGLYLLEVVDADHRPAGRQKIVVR